MSRRILTGALVVLSLTSVSGQQTRQPAASPDPPTPTFRLDVEYVEVDVRATDEKGNFIRDLTKEDFQISEDGKPQAIAGLSLIDVPTEPSPQPVAPAVAIEPDVQSNERRFDGRAYVMILDDDNTAPDRTARTKNAARRFVEQHLGANDLMAVVFTFSGEPAQEFTSNKQLLLAAIDKFVGLKRAQRTLPQPMPPGPGPAEPLFTLGASETFQAGNRAAATLRNVMTWLEGQTGRRNTVVLVSEGFVMGSPDPERPPEVVSRENVALELANGRIGRANVNIYTVDMRGPGATQQPLDTLSTLAENNGGFVVMDNNDIGRGFARLVAENSTYYLLGYYASHPRDGKFHSIDVRVKRPRVRLRARKGYSSRDVKPPAPRTPGDPQASVTTIAALSSPVQRSDLRLRVFAAPFRATSNASVLVGIELAGRDLPLESGGTVEISYVAVDAKSKEHGWRTDRLALNLQPETRARVERNGMSVLKRMDLPPGRYRLRVAASDPGRNVAGSVIHDLEVPDFEQAKLAMSGVLLMSKSAAATLTAHADEQTRSVLPAPPTAARAFPQDDEIAIFAEVYAASQAPSDGVDIVTTIRSEAGEVVFEETETREASELQGGYRHIVQIPLEMFDPGAFILSVEAKSARESNTEAAARRVPFTVTAVDPR
jgi:Ca-activated chloride channel family protein